MPNSRRASLTTLATLASFDDGAWLLLPEEENDSNESDTKGLLTSGFWSVGWRRKWTVSAENLGAIHCVWSSCRKLDGSFSASTILNFHGKTGLRQSRRVLSRRRPLSVIASFI